jgi:hypothetical protein
MKGSVARDFHFPVFLFCLLLLPGVAKGESRTLTILYTGAVNGELEPCGCSPKTDFGGLPRRAGYLESNRDKVSPSLLIDAGNFTGDVTPQGLLKAAAMSRSLVGMRYDAVALLTREKGYPREVISSWFPEGTIRVLSDLPGYSGSISLNQAGIPVNLSVDPTKTQKDAVNILLSDRPLGEIHGKLRGWAVVILSSGETLEEPFRIGRTVVVAGYPKGERLGVLILSLDEKARVSGFIYRWQLLGPETQESENVRGILRDYDAQVAGMFREAEAPSSEQSPYLGVSRCQECHRPFVESWNKTRHARAWEALEKVGKSHDPECVRCHVVGFGQPGGFRSIEATPPLADVQCEVCHGPGRDHLTNGYGPMRDVGVLTCLGCHTQDHSPDFQYPEYRKRIEHLN